MSDEEIKKALECCAKGVRAEVCDKCSFKKDGNIVNLNCLNLEKYALDLIKRQQERIEELEIITGLANNRKYYRKFVDEVFCKQKGKELSEPDFDYIYQLYFEQQAVIDDLKHEIRNLECEKGQLEGTIDFLVAEAKSEAIKEFAEMLKEGIGFCDLPVEIVVDHIDSLVKEMAGGE